MKTPEEEKDLDWYLQQEGAHLGAGDAGQLLHGRLKRNVINMPFPASVGQPHRGAVPDKAVG